MLKIEVRCLSTSGNTEKLAKAIAEEAGVTAKPITESIVDEADLLFLGGAVYAFGIDNELKQFILNLDGQVKKMAVFSTTALVKSAFLKIKKLLDVQKIPVVTEEFHCRGGMKSMQKGRPDENDILLAKEFARAVIK